MANGIENALDAIELQDALRVAIKSIDTRISKEGQYVIDEVLEPKKAQYIQSYNKISKAWGLDSYQMYMMKTA